MSDNTTTDLAMSTVSGITHVDEEAQQQQAQWAIPEEEANHGSQQSLQHHDEDGQVQNLRQYLTSCHNMNQAAQSFTDGSCGSQAIPIEPEGKLYPKQIVSSPDFMEKQIKVWDVVLADDNSALLQKMFPSMEQVHDEYFSMEPVNGEWTLCVFERLGVSKAVMNLLHSVLDDEVLSKAVGLSGDIAYGSFEQVTDSEEADNVSGSEPHCSFCVYSNTKCGRLLPLVGMEYRPSDLPMVREITTALAEDIVPERDVIGREDDAYTFTSGSKQLVTATITQLFDRMVKSGVPYGYIFTGEAIIFVEIHHDDPSIVHYHVSVPDNDVSDQDESTLYRSAVGQIFAFIIRAMQAAPLSAQWHDKIANLDSWRGSCSEARLTRPSCLSVPSSSRTTSCGDEVMNNVDTEYEQVGEDNENEDADQDNHQGDENEDEDEEYDYALDIEENIYVAIDINLESCQDGHLVPMREDHLRYARQEGDEGLVDDGVHPYWIQGGRIVASDIRQRQYCTQQCLLGVVNDEPLDPACPNVDKHGVEHIDNMDFLKLVQSQLTRTRRVSGSCISLKMKGSLGAVFKAMIPSRGYTFVAKGVSDDKVPRLLREADTYNRLKACQGGSVPVYLGIVQLEAAFEDDGVAYSHFMLLSWAGRPVGALQQSAASSGFVNSTRQAYMELHNAGLIHNDAELRNMMYNPQLDRIMLVDFERSSIYECHVAQFVYRDTSRSCDVIVEEEEDDEDVVGDRNITLEEDEDDEDAVGDRNVTIEDVEDDEDAGGSGSGTGSMHVHNYIPGHCYGGGLRRVNRCENLRREFEAASERELGRAVNLMANLTQNHRPREVRWE